MSTAIYQRMVCGVDGSPEAIEAVRQAARIAGQSALARLVTAIQPWDDLWDAELGQQLATARKLEREADWLLTAAQRALSAHAPVELVKKEGGAWEVLLGEAAGDPECLLALGPPEQARLTGIVSGETVTHLLHKAPCSVLVARGQAGLDAFPRAVVVGVDGSAESELAFAVARELRDRYGSELRPTVARGGKGVDLEAVQRILGGSPFRVDESRPANALRSASADADLVIVGSRGLHGARSLGSVSERVGHQARSSVLVVRGVSLDGDVDAGRRET